MTEPGADPRSFESDFYEEDEPIEKILAIFEEGVKGVTALPEEAVDDLVTVDSSPWLQEVSHTSPARHAFTWERQKSKTFTLRLSGAAPS